MTLFSASSGANFIAVGQIIIYCCERVASPLHNQPGYFPSLGQYPFSSPSGVTGGGGGCLPEASDPENFGDVWGKKRQGKKVKRVKSEKKRRKIGKGKVENWKCKQESFKKSWGPFFCCFCFSLLKTMKICFGSTKMQIFNREKAFHARKKISLKWLRPLRKICLLCPGVHLGGVEQMRVKCLA